MIQTDLPFRIRLPLDPTAKTHQSTPRILAWRTIQTKISPLIKNRMQTALLEHIHWTPTLNPLPELPKPTPQTAYRSSHRNARRENIGHVVSGTPFRPSADAGEVKNTKACVRMRRTRPAAHRYPWQGSPESTARMRNGSSPVTGELHEGRSPIIHRFELNCKVYSPFFKTCHHSPIPISVPRIASLDRSDQFEAVHGAEPQPRILTRNSDPSFVLASVVYYHPFETFKSKNSLRGVLSIIFFNRVELLHLRANL